jgi:hypothetical protein
LANGLIMRYVLLGLRGLYIRERQSGRVFEHSSASQ